MAIRGERDRQSADWAEVPLGPLVTLAVQLLVLEFGSALLACPPVLLAMVPLAVHSAVLDEEARIAVLQLDDGAALDVSVFPAVGAHASWVVDCGATHNW